MTAIKKKCIVYDALVPYQIKMLYKYVDNNEFRYVNTEEPYALEPVNYCEHFHNNNIKHNSIDK